MLKPIASWLAVALGLTGLASAQGTETSSEAELAAQLVAQFDRIHSPLGLGLIDVEGYSTQHQDEGFLLVIEGASVTGLVDLGDLMLSVVPQGDTLAIELLDAPQGARISPALAEAAALSWDQFSLSGAWSLELGAYLDLTFALEGLRGEAEGFSATWDSLSIEVQRSGERIRFAYQATPLRIALNRGTPLLVELGALDWQGVRSGEGAAPSFTTLLNFVEIMRNSAKLLGTREAEAVARLNGALAAAWRATCKPGAARNLAEHLAAARPTRQGQRVQPVGTASQLPRLRAGRRRRFYEAAAASTAAASAADVVEASAS